MAEPEAIDQFVLITGAPVHIATHVLEAHDWDVDAAVNFYLESGGVGHGNFGLPTEQVLPEPAPRPLPLPANAAPRSSPIEASDYAL